MTPLMTPPLASLGMLLWWAATSSAMPLDKSGAPYEADGPDAHELSLQPVGRGAHLDFERQRATTTCGDNGWHDGQACCTRHIDRKNNAKSCESLTYGDAGRN